MHKTSIDLVKAAPAEIDAGAGFVLQARVACPLACDLRGTKIQIITAAGVVAAQAELTTFGETGNETGEFGVIAPVEPGEYGWTVEFADQEQQGCSHSASSIPFCFAVKPHATGITFWDVPERVVLGSEFALKVGVKCACGCTLAGKRIEIYDDEGNKVAEKTLGDIPRPEEAALSCAEVKLVAPGLESLYQWTAKFPDPELALAHAGASTCFSFGTVRQPEHVVTVAVIDKDTGAPVENACTYLRPHIYRGSRYQCLTDRAGVAKISVPQGKYDLYVAGPDELKQAVEPTVVVDGDVDIRVELVPVPTVAERLGMV